MSGRATDIIESLDFRCLRQTVIGSGVWLTLAVVITAGCGNSERPTYPAGGRVKFPNGSPLAHGWVSFRPVDGKSKSTARGEIRPDGSFELTTFEPGDGAVPGRHQALVVAPVDQNLRWGTPRSAPAPLIHERFTRFESSKLEFVVTDDSNKNKYEIIVTK